MVHRSPSSEEVEVMIPGCKPVHIGIGHDHQPPIAKFTQVRNTWCLDEDPGSSSSQRYSWVAVSALDPKSRSPEVRSSGFPWDTTEHMNNHRWGTPPPLFFGGGSGRGPPTDRPTDRPKGRRDARREEEDDDDGQEGNMNIYMRPYHIPIIPFGRAVG